MKQKFVVDIDMQDQDILNVLTGIVLQNAAVLATDSVRTAIGKLQGQINAPSIQTYNATSVASFVTTSTTDVLITDMSVTPVAGTYLALFSGKSLGGNNNSVSNISLYKNAAQVADSDRYLKNHSAGAEGTLSTQSLISCNGTDVISARARTTTGSLTITARNLILIRVGA